MFAGERCGAERSAIAQSQSDLLDRLGDVAIHVRSRIEAGLLLGRLGDPRFPVETVNGVKVILPTMVEIEGGVATIGSADDDELADDDEKPRHEVDACSLRHWTLSGDQRRVCLLLGGRRL